MLGKVEDVVDVETPSIGDNVGLDVVMTSVGALVGDKVVAGDDVPQPPATLISTSAQFQNCSGTPLPSGGMLSQTPMPLFPG